jgi:hypothetical protein
VGQREQILHFNGVTWSLVYQGNLPHGLPDLYSVWGSRGTDVYAVGAYGTILHYTGGNLSQWTKEDYTGNSSPATQNQFLTAVWGPSGGNVWAMGKNSISGLVHSSADFPLWNTRSCVEDWYQDPTFPAALNQAVTRAYNELQVQFTANPCANLALVNPDELILQSVNRALETMGAVQDVAKYKQIFDLIWRPGIGPAPYRAQFRSSFEDLAWSLTSCPPVRDDWSTITTDEPRICAMSCDPNAKAGQSGVGTAAYVAGDVPLNYAIYFENLETATLPAAEVVVTDRLDPAKLDFSTFSFGPITFGSRTVTPPPGLTRYQTNVDLRPDANLIVRIVAQVNTMTGLLTAHFQSVDPVTGLDPEDQTLGFLPPNVNSPDGEGSISFNVLPRLGLSDGTVISNAATIVFDTNAPIPTNESVNTIDSNRPSSRVTTLSQSLGEELEVVASWAGTDGAGSGITEYSIFVSDNGSPYSLWKKTGATHDIFPVQASHTYGFYSVARDLIGNKEDTPAPLVPDANITITTNQSPVFTAVPQATSTFEGATVNLSASATDAEGGQTVTVSASGFPASLALTQGSSVMPDTTTATLSGTLGLHDGDSSPTIYTITWVASDGVLSANAATQLTVYETVPIAFDLTPNTLNLRSMGNWVQGYLEPPAPFTPADIDTSSIRINGSVAVDPAAPVVIGDHDSNGIPDLMVKFNRPVIELTMSAGDSVPVTVTGLLGGSYFLGVTYVRVLRAVVNSPAAGAMLVSGSTTTVRWTTPPGLQVQWIALLSSTDDGATWRLDASGLPNTGSCNWVVPGAGTNGARVAVVLVENADATGYVVDGVLATSNAFSIQIPTGVDDPSLVPFTLRILAPNPSQRDLRVNFSLPDARFARLEVFNVSGRLVDSREVGTLGRGYHGVTLGQRSALPSGVYIVRLSQAGKSLATRAILIR